MFFLQTHFRSSPSARCASKRSNRSSIMLRRWTSTTSTKWATRTITRWTGTPYTMTWICCLPRCRRRFSEYQLCALHGLVFPLSLTWRAFLMIFLPFRIQCRPFDRPFERFRSRTEEILRQRLYQLFRRETPMTLRFGELYATEVFPLRVNGIQWRNYVYLRALYADPLSDLNGQFRDISASFFRFDLIMKHLPQVIILDVTQPREIRLSPFHVLCVTRTD